MPATSHSSKKEKLQRVPHFIAAFVILLHGFERFETGHASHVFFFIAGLVFLTVAIFHHRLSAKFPLIDIIFFIIEAMLSFLIAYEFLEAGKHGVPVMYIIAGIFQLLAIFIFSKRINKNNHPHSSSTT